MSSRTSSPKNGVLANEEGSIYGHRSMSRVSISLLLVGPQWPSRAGAVISDGDLPLDEGEGNTKNGNKYLAWAFVEAANFAVRYCPQAKSFYERKKRKTNRHRGDQGAGAQIGARLLPHATRTEALRCESMFRVTCLAKDGEPGKRSGAQPPSNDWTPSLRHLIECI